MKLKNGEIEIENSSKECILIFKKKHDLDIRTVEEVDFEAEIRKLKLTQTTLQLSTLQDIQIDPDRTLPQE